VLLTTASCSGINPLAALTGGTNVAANTQIGRTNSQTLGTTNNTDAGIRTDGNVNSINQDFDSGNKVATDKVENLTINEIPVWVILLLILGWLLPTPTQIGQGILNLFTRKK
jgi:hypothetical protein